MPLFSVWQPAWNFSAKIQQHQDAVIRLAEVPGFGIDSAQQVIAEVGATAAKFSSAAEFTSWVGTYPGKEESADLSMTARWKAESVPDLRSRVSGQQFGNSVESTISEE